MRTEILYEDAQLLVVYKPAGLAAESARIDQTDVVSELKNYLNHGVGIPYLGLAHRLDQPVEGLLAVAKDQKTAMSLSAQLKNGQMKKSYRAVLFLQEESSVEADIPVELTDFMAKAEGRARIVRNASAQSLSGSSTGTERKTAKKAVLTYCIQEVKEQTALARIELKTGRFHQIRCQMAAHGLPLLGDQKYGTAESLAESKALGVRDVALCADKLSFLHPQTGKELRVTIEPRNIAFRPWNGEAKIKA